jgi:cbb3-type cytochrome oxidase maturation protein
MEAVFLLVPLAAVLALGTVAALFWAVRSGQFDDLEGPAHRILVDDEGKVPSESSAGPTAARGALPPERAKRGQ